MTQKLKPPEDSFQIRCPKLGHQIHFSYCRNENSGLPCVRILTCWHPYFAVHAYLRRQLSEEEWKEAFEKEPKPKAVSLAELIEEIQRKKKGDGA